MTNPLIESHHLPSLLEAFDFKVYYQGVRIADTADENALRPVQTQFSTLVGACMIDNSRAAE